VLALLKEAQLIPKGVTDTEAYMHLSALRYMLLRTHEWDDAIIEAVRRDLEHPSRDDDTLVRRLRRELR
jgi:hypothetical protein